MKPMQQTTIAELKIGDRFYKAGDKKKIVYEKVEHEVKKTHFQTYRYWSIEAALLNNSRLTRSDLIDRFAFAVKKDTPIIFLRHTTTENETEKDL